MSSIQSLRLHFPEMDKMQRQNRERLINLEKEIEHLRYLLERAINYELPGETKLSLVSVIRSTRLMQISFGRNFRPSKIAVFWRSC